MRKTLVTLSIWALMMLVYLLSSKPWQARHEGITYQKGSTALEKQLQSHIEAMTMEINILENARINTATKDIHRNDSLQRATVAESKSSAPAHVDGPTIGVNAPYTFPQPWVPSVFIPGDLTEMTTGTPGGNHFCARYPKRPHVVMQLPAHPEHSSMRYSTRPSRIQSRDETKVVTIYQVGAPMPPHYTQIELLSGSQDSRFEVKCPIVCKFTVMDEDIDLADAVLHDEMPDTRWMVPPWWGVPKRLHIIWDNENPLKTMWNWGDHTNMRRFDMTWHWNRNASILGPCHDDKLYIHDSSLSDEPNPAPLFCSPGPKKANALAVTVVANCGSGNKRMETIDEMKSYGLSISEYGGCRGSPRPDSVPTEFNLFIDSYNRKVQVLSEHKFTLAFENDNTPDWVTEKVFHAFTASSIPVYLGSPTINEFVPPHSIIDLRDWPDLRKLVEYLQYLDKNDTAYQEYFAWKKTNTWTIKSWVLNSSKRYQACAACLAVYEERERLKSAGLWETTMYPWERRDNYQVLHPALGLLSVSHSSYKP